MKNIILTIVLLISPFIIDAQNQIENKESKLFLTNEFILDIEVVEILKPGNLFIAIWNSSVAFNDFNRKDKCKD